MKPSDMIPAVNATIDHLNWCADGRYLSAIVLLANVPIDYEDLGGSGGDDETRDRRQKGGHSDPTGDTVCAAAARQHALQAAATRVCDHARWLRQTVTGHSLGTAPGTLTAAAADLEWLRSSAHAVNHWLAPSVSIDNHLHDHLAAVAREAANLRYEVNNALRYSATVAAGRPKPRTLEPCKVCGPWGCKDHGLGASGLCAKCQKFRTEYKCLPTEAIHRQWDYGRKVLPPSLLNEARVARLHTKIRRTA